MMNDGYDGAYRRILHGILPRALPSTLWHIDFVICMSTRRIFDERASDDEAMKICHSMFPQHNIVLVAFRYTTSPHTNVAISRSADDDDDDDKQQSSGNGQNKTQQTVKRGRVLWYRSPHRNKQYTSILYIHHDRYILLWWPVIVWKDEDGRVYQVVVGRNQTMMKMACRGVSTKPAVLSLLIKCRDKGPLNKEMRHWFDY